MHIGANLVNQNARSVDLYVLETSKLFHTWSQKENHRVKKKTIIQKQNEIYFFLYRQADPGPAHRASVPLFELFLVFVFVNFHCKHTYTLISGHLNK